MQSQSWVRNRDNEAVGKCRVFVALYANEKSLIQRQKVTIARGTKSHNCFAVQKVPLMKIIKK